LISLGVCQVPDHRLFCFDLLHTHILVAAVLSVHLSASWLFINSILSLSLSLSVCLFLTHSLSLSLSHTHTHTHTHLLSVPSAVWVNCSISFPIPYPSFARIQIQHTIFSLTHMCG